MKNNKKQRASRAVKSADVSQLPSGRRDLMKNRMKPLIAGALGRKAATHQAYALRFLPYGTERCYDSHVLGRVDLQRKEIGKTRDRLLVDIYSNLSWALLYPPRFGKVMAWKQQYLEILSLAEVIHNGVEKTIPYQEIEEPVMEAYLDARKFIRDIRKISPDVLSYKHVNNLKRTTLARWRAEGRSITVTPKAKNMTIAQLRQLSILLDMLSENMC